MVTPDIDLCFRLLKLPRGSDLAAVKQAYRKNLYKCHPDRFQNQPELLAAAERKTKLLVQVYGTLEKWYQDNSGRDPGSPSPWQAEGPGSQDDTEPDFDDEAGEPPGGIPRWVRPLGVAAAVASFAIFAWSFLSEPKEARPKAGSRPPAIPTPAPAAPQPPAAAAPAAGPPGGASAEVTALTAERDRVRAEWIRSYREGWTSIRAAARKELAEAQAQYDRDVTAQAAAIDQADRERERLFTLAVRESAARKEAYAQAARAAEAAVKRDYEQWLRSEGVEAVSLIQKIREREHSPVGVFSSTEDPAKILEFWTPEEAGSPEINIAAKTGVTVRQPNSRFFTHFRTNLNLYEPEGGVLVRMMEAIVDRRDQLEQKTSALRLGAESEMRGWDQRHPPVPEPLPENFARVLAQRESAVQRVTQARARIDKAELALNPQAADLAFKQSDKARELAERISAASRPTPTGAAGSLH